MAELLVRAKPHWMDSLTKAEVDKMSKEQLQSYNARSQIGDIVCVFPDGACKEPPAPDSVYAITKIPSLDYNTAKEKYEQPLTDITDPKNSILLKHRKYQIPITFMNNAKVSNNYITITSLQKDSFVSSIIEKTK